jgi:hypothetical protein
MGRHQERAAERAGTKEPVNFTCGNCKRVVPFAPNYRCVICEPEVTITDKEEAE